MHSTLNVTSFGVSSAQTQILKNISCSIRTGEVFGVIGPNGAGKTTLLKAISGQLEFSSGLTKTGNVTLEEQSVFAMSLPERARRIAVVNQVQDSVFQLSLRHIVEMGALVHRGLFHRKSEQDERHIDLALEAVGLEEFSARLFHQLSGGEQQRGLIARALVQQSKLLVLDEPINHLDVYFQHQILQLLRHLAHQQSIAVVISLHDLNLAKDYCDTLCLLEHGEALCIDTPERVLQPERLTQVFKLPCHLLEHKELDATRVLFTPTSTPTPLAGDKS